MLISVLRVDIYLTLHFCMSVVNTKHGRRNHKRTVNKLFCSGGPVCRMSFKDFPDDVLADASKTTLIFAVLLSGRKTQWWGIKYWSPFTSLKWIFDIRSSVKFLLAINVSMRGIGWKQRHVNILMRMCQRKIEDLCTMNRPSLLRVCWWKCISHCAS